MRYVVVGTSGSGKSTFARAAAETLNVPHVELDELFWAENWTPKPTEAFARAVREASLGEQWVIDGNYSAVRSVLWPRATHIVWLNFSRTVVFSRVLRRTLKRAVFRQRLWHGNQESIRRAFFSRNSILIWSLTTFAKNRDKYARLRAQEEFAHLSWVELSSPREAQSFLAGLSRNGA